MVRKYSYSYFFASLLAVTSVLAAPRTGISPLDDAVQLIADIFYVPSLQTPFVAANFARAVFFFAIFAILNWAGRKTIFSDKNNPSKITKRTSNIVALCISLLAVAVIPQEVILASAVGYSQIIWTLITLLPAVIALIWAFSSKGDEVSTGRRVAELLALVTGFTWSWFMLSTLTTWVTSYYVGTPMSFIETMNSWVFIFMTIGILVKLFQMLFGFGEGADGKTLADRLNQAGKNLDAWRDFKNKWRGKIPSIVTNVKHAKEGAGVKVTWQVISGESIERYEIQWTKVLKTIAGMNVGTRWNSRSPISQAQAEAGTWPVYNDVPTNENIQFRVRAVNTDNKEGPWGYSTTGRAPPHDFSADLDAIETDLIDANAAETNALSAAGRWGGIDSTGRYIPRIIFTGSPDHAHYQEFERQMGIVRSKLRDARTKLDAVIAHPDYATMNHTEQLRLRSLQIDWINIYNNGIATEAVKHVTRIV